MHLAYGVWTAMLGYWCFHENRLGDSACENINEVVLASGMLWTVNNSANHRTTSNITKKHNSASHRTTIYPTSKHKFASHRSIITCPTSRHNLLLWFEIPTVALPKIQVLCNMTLCHWASCSQYFKRWQCLHLQARTATYLMIQCHIWEDLNLQLSAD